MSSLAPATERRSAARCHAPAHPGRLSALGESNHTAWGTPGRWKNAVVAPEEMTASASARAPARAAASDSTASTKAM
jgi:hypothetical protein